LLSFRIGSHELKLSRDTAAAIVVHGEGDMLLWRETIGRAIGLVQGGRVGYRAGYSQGTVELNFARDVDVQALGRIYDDDVLVSEFLERYVTYERRLDRASLRSHSIAVSYILDGCAGLPSLEQKVISLFTAVEMLDGAKTLSADPVGRLLSINRQQARLLVEVRNGIVHQGLSLHSAITAARQHLGSHGALPKLPFRVTGVSKTAAAANLHFFLATGTVSVIARRIGMSTMPTSYLEIYKRRTRTN
jgi:hypothetical protein